MAAKTKLELTWIGKDIRPRLEPRILIEDPAFSHHAEARREGDIFDNLLIHGDNLLALKALETDPSVRGRVKCVFIDPPYNTGSAFEHYDDGLEHSLWLGMMRERLELIKDILHEDGTLWITIDDNEVHYLKVLCDEVFGRSNFVSNIVWQSKDTPGNNASAIAQTHNHVLVYKKNQSWRPNLIPRNEKQIANYKNPDNDPRGPWLGTPMTRAEHRDRDYYALKNDAGTSVMPPSGSSWRRPPSEIKRLQEDNRIYWGKNGNAEFPVEKKFLSEVKEGIVPQTWWPYEFAGSTRNASAEMKKIFEGRKSFDTPKPERIVSRALEIATNPGDLVLDSFAGSGTTGAVAHKMGRRWIMVELGEHAKTHIVPRMQKVIDGTDKGGVTEAAGWKGGGGYRFCRLAPSMLEKDQWDNWVIAKGYNPEMLAEAMCKHFNFTYAPSTEHYWMHGQSSESAFIYVTTNSLTFDQLRALSDEVGNTRSLLVCCMAYEAGAENLTNLTLRKIPQAVLNTCEWGKDDYSLKIESLPMMAEEEDDDTPAPKATRKGKGDAATPDLFAEDEGE